jgi:WD40-like Beta Propeller Repeat
VGLVGLVAASFTSASGVKNAGVTWGSYDAIRGAKVDGSGRHVVVPPFADNEGDPAWTRDGQKLALFGSFSDTVRLYVFSPKTRRLRPVGGVDSRSFEPTWSPDAKRIAVSQAWGPFGIENPESTIKIVSLATDKWTSVTKPRRHRVDDDPAWSPNGRTIAFARKHDGGTATLYLVHPDGTALRRLTKGRSPSWRRTGSASRSRSAAASTRSAPTAAGSNASSAASTLRSCVGPPTAERSSTRRPGVISGAMSGPPTSPGHTGGASFTASRSRASRGAPDDVRAQEAGAHPTDPARRAVVDKSPPRLVGPVVMSTTSGWT